jgi:hypothetical protein
MCASAAAGSMRIMLMPVDAWKTIKQVPSERLLTAEQHHI